MRLHAQASATGDAQGLCQVTHLFLHALEVVLNRELRAFPLGAQGFPRGIAVVHRLVHQAQAEGDGEGQGNRRGKDDETQPERVGEA